MLFHIITGLRLSTGITCITPPGHFTQIVWRASTTLGCGKATGKDGNDYVVCNYDPAGNIAGRTPFDS
jgi:hypothetical protein